MVNQIKDFATFIPYLVKMLNYCQSSEIPFCYIIFSILWADIVVVIQSIAALTSGLVVEEEPTITS